MREYARTSVKRAFNIGPNQVRVAVVEAGFAGVVGTGLAAVIRTADALEPYDVPWTYMGQL